MRFYFIVIEFSYFRTRIRFLLEWILIVSPVEVKFDFFCFILDRLRDINIFHVYVYD